MLARFFHYTPSNVTNRRALAQFAFLLVAFVGICPPLWTAAVTPPARICSPVPTCEETQRSCRPCPKAPQAPARESRVSCEACVVAPLPSAGVPELRRNEERKVVTDNLVSSVAALRGDVINRRIDVRSASPPIHLLVSTLRN